MGRLAEIFRRYEFDFYKIVLRCFSGRVWVITSLWQHMAAERLNMPLLMQSWRQA
jgi:hypothetical protein